MKSAKQIAVIALGVYVGLVLASLTLTWIDTVVWGIGP